MLEQDYPAIAFCGLDYAGKTSILRYLTEGEQVDTDPTYSSVLQLISLKIVDFDFRTIDMGGQFHLRSEWGVHLSYSDVIVFVIDASDKDRLIEAKTEFIKIQEYVKGKKVLILANKQDLDKVVPKDEIIDFLELNNSSQFSWKLIETSALTGEGIYDAFVWIYTQITGKNLDQDRLKAPSEHIRDRIFFCFFTETCELDHPMACYTCPYARCDNCRSYSSKCVELLIERTTF